MEGTGADEQNDGRHLPHDEDRDSDKKRLLKELKTSYPGVFTLYNDPDVSAVTPSKWKSILSKLKDDSCDSVQELIQNQNFRVFLYTLLGQRDKAKEVNAVVLEKDPSNVSALVAKGILLCIEHNTVQAQEIADQLRGMQENDAEFPSLKAQAEGDVGYAYSRMGPRFYKRSIEKFQTALRDCQDNEAFHSSWKFGFALTVQRTLHMGSSFYRPHKDDEECAERVMMAVEYLLDIAMDETLKKSLRGKAYVLMPQIYSFADFPHLEYVKAKVETVFIRRTRQKFFPQSLIKKALELAPEDVFVLEFSSKFYRIQKDYEKARDCCERAISVCPTARAYTYLGLVHLVLAGKKAARQQRSRGGAASQQGSRTPSHSYSTILDSHRDPVLLDANDDNVKAAIQNFKKALKINQSDVTIYQKLGTVYRRTGNYDTSIEYIRKMLDQTINTPTPLDQVAGFEVMGECYMEKKKEAEKEGDQDEMRRCGIQAESMFMKAISAACDAVRSIPNFSVEECVASFSTLEEILTAKDQTTSEGSRHKDLADLYRLVGRYSDSVGFLKTLCEQNPAELGNFSTLKKLIWSYSKSGDHYNAFESLQLLSFTGHAQSLMEDDVFVREICFSALESFIQQDDRDTCKTCVRCLLQLCGSPTLACRDEDGFDVIILHEDEDVMDDVGGEVEAVLREWCGLRVTRNFRDVLLCYLDRSGQVEVMRKARAFLTLLGPSQISPVLQFFLDHALQLRKDGKPLAVLASKRAVRPPLLAVERHADCPPAEVLRGRSPYVLRGFLKDVLSRLLL